MTSQFQKYRLYPLATPVLDLIIFFAGGLKVGSLGDETPSVGSRGKAGAF